MSTLVELDSISVQYGQRQILDNISLCLNRREITTLVGPNGAGKSTLVKVLLGLQTSFRGKVRKSKQLKIGYVPQKLKLNDSLPLSVSRFLQLTGKCSKAQLQQILQLVGAQHLLSSNMHSLSGGENQRVLLARALLQQPDLLVLDEPAQGVDVQGQIDLYELIDTIRQRYDCGVFMVSHDLHLVMAKTDHVVCINHHICCSGAPSDITQHPSYIELFGYTQQQPLAFYHHQHQHHHDLAGTPVAGDADKCCNHSHGHHHD